MAPYRQIAHERGGGGELNISSVLEIVERAVKTCETSRGARVTPVQGIEYLHRHAVEKRNELAQQCIHG